MLIVTGCVLFICLCIYSCTKKRDEIIIKPGTNAVLTTVPDNLLQAAKDWQAEKLKSPSTLSIKSASKAKLGAVWQEAELQILPNGQQVMVVQSPKIKLGSNSKAGIVRKFVFEIQNNKIFNGKIIEIFGTSEYINTHKDNLLENYNINKLGDFSGGVAEYDINYNYISSKIYEKGQVKVNAFGQVKRVKQQQQAVPGSKITQSLTTLDYYNCIDYYWVVYANGYPIYEQYLYTVCDGSPPDDNEVGGGDPPPPGGGGGEPERVLTKDVEFTVNETNFTDDDLGGVYTADIGSTIVPPYGYTPVQYKYPVHIVYTESTLQIISVAMGNVLAYPNNETYYGIYGTNVTRTVTPITLAKFYSIAGSSATVSWECAVTFRYTYANTGNSQTRPGTANYSAVVTVP